MRSLILVAGFVASLALTPGPKPADAQVYDGYYNYYPPYNGYYYPPPSYGGYYAHPYYRHYYPHYYRARYYHPYGGYAYASCGYRRHRAGAIGAVAGTFGGGIIGAAATHGNPAYTMLGAGLGALTGSLIGHNSHPYPC